MRTRIPRAAGVIVASFLFGSLTLTGCAGGDSPASDTETDAAPPAASTPSPVDDDSTGQMFGCTQTLIDYAADNGYPEATPADPATFSIPEAAFEVTPDCYIADEYEGASRFGAFWVTDPDGTLAQLGAALDAAGYVQSDDYGPLVWWLGGDDPMTAEHAIAAAPQPVEGTTVLWATW